MRKTRIRHSLNKGQESAASAWQALADEILNEGSADLSLKDAKNATVLETAVTHRLNEIAVQIYFRRQVAGDLLLESENEERLMPAAVKVDNFPMLEFLKTGGDFENALTEYVKEEGPAKMTPAEKAAHRRSILAVGIILANASLGVHIESGQESDWPLWLRTLPYTAVSFIPAGWLIQSRDGAEQRKAHAENWKEALKGEEEAFRARIKTNVRLAAEALRKAGIKLKEAEIKKAAAPLAAQGCAFLKKAKEKMTLSDELIISGGKDCMSPTEAVLYATALTALLGFFPGAWLDALFFPDDPRGEGFLGTSAAAVGVSFLALALTATVYKSYRIRVKRKKEQGGKIAAPPPSNLSVKYGGKRKKSADLAEASSCQKTFLKPSA